MANYKKITDVEVMEEVSENSMALVNENGVLKQVPCAGFGGGSGFVGAGQIKLSEIWQIPSYNNRRQNQDSE